MPRENSTATAPTKTTNRNVPAKDIAVEHLVPPPASASSANVRPLSAGFVVWEAEASTIAAEPIEKISVVTAVTISTRRRRS